MTRISEEDARVFISYSRKDKDVAQELRDALIVAGFDAFLDVHDIAPGEPWEERLEALIATAEKVVFLISPKSVTSKICAWEVDCAEGQGKAIMPLMVRETEPKEIPGRLSRLNFIFYRDEAERATNLKTLVEALNTDLSWEREKTRINELAVNWDKAKRPKRLLLWRNDAIREIEKWRDSQPIASLPPTEIQLDFISECRLRYQSRQRFFAAGMIIVSLITSVAAVVALKQRSIAMRERDETLLTQSRYLAGFSEQNTDAGDIGNAIALASHALPADLSNPDRPISQAAFSALYYAYSAQTKTPVPLKNIFKGQAGIGSGAINLAKGKLLTWGPDLLARIWDTYDTPGQILKGHNHDITGALHLTDGRILTWDASKVALFWAPDGTPGPVFNRKTAGAIQLSDGRILTWDNEDNAARLWSANGKPGPILKGHIGAITGALQLKDGRLLTWTGEYYNTEGSEDHTARLWSANGKPGPILKGHTSAITGALQLKDGRLLTWTGGGDHTARLWSTNGKTGPILKGHIGAITGALQLKDGRILTSDYSCNISLWNLDGTLSEKKEEIGNHQVLDGGDNGVMQLADGNVLCWAEYSIRAGILQTRDVLERKYPKEIPPFARPPPWGFEGALLLGNGQIMTWNRGYGGSDVPADGWPWNEEATAWIWDYNYSASFHRSRHNYDDNITGAIQLSNGRLLTWGGVEHEEKDKHHIANLLSADGTLASVLKGHTDFITGALQLKDGRLLTWAGGGDHTARLWSANGKPGPILKGHIGAITGALQLKDGRLLTWAGGGGHTARLWSTNGKTGPILKGHTSAIIGALQLKDERLLTWAGGRDYTARLWTTNGKPGPILKGHTDSVTGALQLKDGRLLTWTGEYYNTEGSEDHTARLWSANGKPGPILKGHIGAITGALQLKDGRLLTWTGGYYNIAGNKDHTARIWSANGKPGPVLKGHTGAITGALQLKDERLLTWAGGGDHTARLWFTNGKPGPILKGHTDAITGALQLKDGRILTLAGVAPVGDSENNDAGPRLWTSAGVPGPVIRGFGQANRALQLDDSRLLIWIDNLDSEVRGASYIFPLEADLLKWGRYITETVRPLDLGERCKYHIEAVEDCKAIISKPEWLP